MSIKAQKSGDYLAQQRTKHGWKPHRPPSRRLVITGADIEAKNIGWAIAESLAWETKFYQLDIRHEEEVHDGKSPIYQGATDLVLSHGVTHLDWFEDAPAHKLREIIDVNLTGTALVIQNFVKATIDAPYRKRIVVIGSMAHRAVLNGSAMYCASKAGVAHLVRCLAWELAPKGFDIYCVHPSNVADAPMSEETIRGLMRYRNMTREEAEAYWCDSPIRSAVLTKEEIAEVVGFLLSGCVPYLAGSQIELAGGMR